MSQDSQQQHAQNSDAPAPAGSDAPNSPSTTAAPSTAEHVAPAAPPVFASWAKTFGMLFRGEPGLPWFPGRQTPAVPLQWLVAALINAGAAWLIFLVYGLAQPGGLEIGSVFVSLILFPLLSVALIALRAVSIMGVFAMGKRKIGFVDAANIASLSFIAVLPTFALAFIAALAPHAITIGLWMLAVVFTVVLSETDIYITSAKAGRFDKSAMMPFALMTLAFVFVVGLLLGLLAMLAWDAMVPSSIDDLYGYGYGGFDW